MPDIVLQVLKVQLNELNIYFKVVLIKNKKNGVGKNEYLTEYKHFNPWISYNGQITWVPEVRINTKCLIKVNWKAKCFYHFTKY